MGKKLISSILLISLIVSGVGCSKANSTANKSDEAKPKIVASYTKISGLNELKSKSDLIVEAEGTDKYELIDYKGVQMRKTTVKVTDVIKGDKQLKELKVLQSENVEGDDPLANGEKVLIFLRKGIDNTDSYVAVGGTQGIYKIAESTDKSKVGVQTIAKSNNANKSLKPHSLVNNDILKDLSGNYDDVKKNLAN